MEQIGDLLKMILYVLLFVSTLNFFIIVFQKEKQFINNFYLAVSSCLVVVLSAFALYAMGIFLDEVPNYNERGLLSTIIFLSSVLLSIINGTIYLVKYISKK